MTGGQSPIYFLFVLFRLHNRILPASQPQSLDCAFLGRQGLRGGTAVWIPQSTQQRSVREGLCISRFTKVRQYAFPSCERVRAWREQSSPSASRPNLRGLFGPFSLQERAGLEGGLGDGMPVSTPRPSTAQTQTSRKPVRPPHRPSRPLSRRALQCACVTSIVPAKAGISPLRSI